MFFYKRCLFLAKIRWAYTLPLCLKYTLSTLGLGESGRASMEAISGGLPCIQPVSDNISHHPIKRSQVDGLEKGAKGALEWDIF